MADNISRVGIALLTYSHPKDKKMDIIETYISWILLMGDYVFKVKRPVNYGYLDFTTLAKRKFYCQREVELNKRLCPDIYLGVVSVNKDGDRVDVGDEDNKRGEVLEYAVKMRRLPQDRMLDALLAKNQVTPDMMIKVAEKLAGFHKKAETSRHIRSYGGILAIADNAEENFNQTGKFIGQTITEGQYRSIKDYTQKFVVDNAILFGRRVGEGRIRDCHGDVHAQHICFTESGICIYDCVEFNDRFRYSDVASEIAFLAMDLDFLGRSDLSRIFVDAYVRISGDGKLPKLLDFYKVYRAFVRGKVNCFRMDDSNISQGERDEALDIARRYFELAESYIKEG